MSTATAGYGDLVDAVPGYALKTAATLHLADHIADGHRTAPAIATAAHADPAALERLLKYLCSRDIFAWSPDTGYHLTPFSRLLIDEHPSQLRRTLDLDGHGARMDQAIAALPYVMRTGRPSYPTLFGKSFYDDYAETPGYEDDFAAVRQRQAHLHGRELGRLLTLAHRTHLVDVGGGTGALVSALVADRPDLTATVLDLPGLTDAAESAIRHAGVADRVDFAAGDFFDTIPAGDLHIISNTLFNWDDTHAETILTNCLRTSRTGRIAIVEHVLSTTPTEEELALDLRNLAVTGGRQRTRQQFDTIANHVGLGITSITPLEYRTLSLLELSPGPNP